MAQTRKILLVDDDPDFRASTRKILESGGYQVVEAASGEEGFAKAKTYRPDLAVIDIIMESFSEGFNLIKRLNEDEWTKGVPRIILTSLGLQQETDMISAEELGTKYIVQKPVQKDDFLRVVAAAIRTVPTAKRDELGDAG